MSWLAKHRDIRAYVEPKKRLMQVAKGDSFNVAEKIAAALTDADVAARTWITHYNSPDGSPLLRTDYPEVNLLEKTGAARLDPADVASEGYDTVGIAPGKITSDVVEGYHAVGITVQGQNSNRRRAWRQTIHAGADALLTDDPETVDAFCLGAFVAPVINRFGPRRGRPGSTVLIRGKDFRYVIDVRFANRSVVFHKSNSHTIVARTPRSRAPKLVRIRVETDYGTAISQQRYRSLGRRRNG